ncbi:hypothetical protein [Mucilaginibacter conchicola]|nr:hypothetical protein [Mucilaginibacter conchicola]
MTAVLALAVAAAAAYRTALPLKKAIKNTDQAKVKAKPSYDVAQLDTLRAWAKTIDLSSLNGALKGRFSVQDSSISPEQGPMVDYLICRKGQDCYFRYGSTETLNARGIYIYIDHAQQKIVWGRQKAIETPSVISQEMLDGAMTGEGYSLTTSQEGKVRTLRLLNPRHASCQEYALTFDPVLSQVVRVFARVKDADGNGGQATKTVDLKLNGYDPKAKPSDYLQQDRVIAVRNGITVPAAGFRNYQLINID